jgi:hypothetical protein
MRGVVLSVLDVVALGDKPERDGLVVDDDELMMTLRAGTDATIGRFGRLSQSVN